jgi:hypothetical protein
MQANTQRSQKRKKKHSQSIEQSASTQIQSPKKFKLDVSIKNDKENREELVDDDPTAHKQSGWEQIMKENAEFEQYYKVSCCDFLVFCTHIEYKGLTTTYFLYICST